MNDNIKAGADHHAGDGGYSIGTQERYEEFVKLRNRVPNELIRELEKQATETVKCGLNGTSTTESFNRKKFAELIVEECADLCDRFQARNVGMQPAECAGAIRKMFGVKE